MPACNEHVIGSVTPGVANSRGEFEPVVATGWQPSARDKNERALGRRPLGSRSTKRNCGADAYQSKPLLLELDPESIEPQVSVVVTEQDSAIDPHWARQCTSLDPQPHPSNGDGSRVFDEALSSKE